MGGVVLMALAAAAQTGKNVAVNSHEVHPDGSITFRLAAPGAKTVLVRLEGSKPLPMVKDDAGVWSVTTAPLKPEVYGYGFTVDGVAQLDPLNRELRPNTAAWGANVLVPASPPAPWEMQAIPHGVVAHYVFTAKNAVYLPYGQSEYYVYTPPGYDAKSAKPYPVLYLLHGHTDVADSWLKVGKANLIFDDLIHRGKMKPMVVVMPLGYGDWRIVTPPAEIKEKVTAAEVSANNTDRFLRVLQEEIMPSVERDFHVRRDRDGRALAGLSMGGNETYMMTMRHPEVFAWAGMFSGGLAGLALEDLPVAPAAKAKFKLLWMSCGTEDPRVETVRKVAANVQAKGLAVTEVETPGTHDWMVWRDDLVRFAPLLF